MTNSIIVSVICKLSIINTTNQKHFFYFYILNDNLTIEGVLPWRDIVNAKNNIDPTKPPGLYIRESKGFSDALLLIKHSDYYFDDAILATFSGGIKLATGSITSRDSQNNIFNLQASDVDASSAINFIVVEQPLYGEVTIENTLSNTGTIFYLNEYDFQCIFIVYSGAFKENNHCLSEKRIYNFVFLFHGLSPQPSHFHIHSHIL